MVIQSKQNPKIKRIRKLFTHKGRQSEGCFVFEGIKLFEEAINNQVPLIGILVSRRFTETDQQRLDAVPPEISIDVVENHIFNSISHQKNPEGIICVSKFLQPEIGFQNCHHLLLLDELKDPGNLGTIIRTADSVGFDGVVCSKETVDFYNDKVIRASMGSFFHIPVCRENDFERFVQTLRQKGFFVCATSLEGKVSFESPMPKHCSKALILGNESHGIRTEIEKLCDISWKLPILGQAESLNVAVAAGIMMYLTIIGDRI
ncbi:TrmH family RNA methyltransferase [Pseudoramibacter sp.]|uniref:TrmH family RNA methyltransferase n=1 Tax=Pseudoramibacter sp. TaxID=2034862 RepID=UPI0025F55796|nr:RNA methyltransferase [Pseudoramibacter sp.]MCH4072926.1 RNA methyltransferase [Pseudoramibacter sp.]MCH4106697.1 RNA methyltransferase [Pseudoramibacter sp.]